MKEIDYIIVGQGLAGSAIAVQLIKRRKKILVIDSTRPDSASRVAAGLFNPVTGNKMTKTWLADTIFPYLYKFYSEVEAETNKSFFNSLPLYRPFLSIEEQNEWMIRSVDESYKEYISQVFTKPAIDGITNPLGGILLRHCGFVNTAIYLEAVREWIGRDGYFVDKKFESSDVIVNEDGVNYCDFQANFLIMCSGVEKVSWWDWIPVTPMKGETITVKSNFRHDVIANRGVYAVPCVGDGLLKVGATYNHHDATTQLTGNAKVELEEKLGALFSDSFETVDQSAGLRPVVPDKKPLLGIHPEHSKIAVFNGLGTKGVSLAPYFSEVLIQSLENGVPLNKDVDVNRYKSVYWKVRK